MKHTDFKHIADTTAGKEQSGDDKQTQAVTVLGRKRQTEEVSSGTIALPFSCTVHTSIEDPGVEAEHE